MLRWPAPRPANYRWSDMVLGRRATLTEFVETGEVIVSCYPNSAYGRPYNGISPVRYTDPIHSRRKCAGPGVLYRIRVRKK